MWLGNSPRDEELHQTMLGMVASRHIAQSKSAGSVVAASSLSLAEGMQTEGTVQFDTAVMYAEEGESCQVNIMRLGGLHTACSVDYETADSERWGNRFEALKGTVHFKPGDRMKTVILHIAEDDEYQGSEVEILIRLSNPQGCRLSGHLKQVRVKLLDDDVFPTNKFAEDVQRDHSTESWREGKNFSMLVEFGKLVYRRTSSGSIKLIAAGQVNNLIYISEIRIMMAIVNAFSSDDDPPSFMYIIALALGLVIPFGITHLLSYQSKGWGVGGGARRLLLEGLMASFLNCQEVNRHKLNTYQWMAVFNVEVLTLVDDGYMQFFVLIDAIGKVVILAFFMFYLALAKYFETGEKALFFSIVPFFLMPPIICGYLQMRAHGTEKARLDVETAAVRLSSFAGECVSHHRTIADYWSRPVALAETMKLIRERNRKLSCQARRKANDEAFFGWLIKLVEFCTISGLCLLVIHGAVRVGTFTAVLSGLTRAAKEFQKAYRSMMTMQACYPCLWKCVVYMNAPTDLWERRDRLAEVRRLFADRIHMEELGNPRGVPEDSVPLTLENITFCYKGHTSPIFRGLMMTVNQGEFVGILGAHGCGKNTLLQIICGIHLPTKGRTFAPPHLRILHLRYQESLWKRPLSDILYYGYMASSSVTRVEDLDEGAIRLGMEVCRQLQLHDGLLEWIEREARSRGELPTAESEKLAEASRIYGAGLSTDSRFKLQLACALLAQPEVLVVHKPVAYASWAEGDVIMNVLRRFVDQRGLGSPASQVHGRRPRTCIVSMQKAVFLDKFHRVLELKDGNIRELSGTERVGAAPLASARRAQAEVHSRRASSVTL